MTEDLATRVRALLGADPAAAASVSDRRMFGGVSFFVGDVMVVAARPDGDLLVRVAADRHDELAGRPGAAAARMGARSMGRGWLAVGGDALATDEALAGWLALACEAVGDRRPVARDRARARPGVTPRRARP